MNTFALVVPFLLAATAFAQETAKSPPKEAPKEAPKELPKDAPKAAAKEPFVVEAGEVKLPALIDRCAAYLDCNILWDAREMETSAVQPVRLQKAISTDQDGCLEFLASSLCRNSFALTWADEKKRTLEAICMVGPRGREVTARAQSCELKDVLARPTLMMPVSVVVPLQNINATIATNALRPVFAAAGGPGSGSLTLGNVGANNAMLVIGMQDRVAQAIGMIREVDKPPPGEAERAPDAARRIETLEKQVAELQTQVKILTDKLADALKNRK